VIRVAAAVELIDDLEDRLVPLSRRRPRRQQPAYPQVRLGRKSSGISE